MPKVEESHKEARREQILIASLECFAEQGIHKTTMQDICKKSNLSAGAVYSYFKSKDEIIESIAKIGQQQSDERFMSASTTGKDYLEKFRIALGAFIDCLHDPFRRTCTRMDIMVLAESFSNEKLNKLFTANYNAVLENIKKMMLEGQKEKIINSKLDADALAQILFGVVQSLSIQLNINPKIDINAYKETVIEVLLDGMRAEGKGSSRNENKVNEVL